MYKKIYLDAPNVGEAEKKYLARAIDDGYVSTVGPFVSKFEENFAGYLGTKKAISTQSGTTAIYMALYELGIKKGDEVIVPALTFVATVNPVKYLNATPVFVDIAGNTWNIDPEKIEEAVTKRTKAIMPVHFYGNPCEMDRIIELAKKHKLFVVEDATESLGAKYLDRHTGTFGDFGCFSFNGNKIITTGGGGMVTGNNVAKLEHIKFLANQGRDETKGYYHPEVGFNYRMTNLEAALGLVQMNKLRGFLNKKREFYNIYRKELKGKISVHFQEEYRNAKSSRWLTCVRFGQKINIVNLQRKLGERGIPTRRIFMPVTEFPPYRKYKKGSYSNAYEIYENGLCLPGSTLNSEEDIYLVCKTLKELV